MGVENRKKIFFSIITKPSSGQLWLIIILIFRKQQRRPFDDDDDSRGGHFLSGMFHLDHCSLFSSNTHTHTSSNHAKWNRQSEKIAKKKSCYQNQVE